MSEQIVLVVDDSPTILKLAEMVLARTGLRVMTASSGESGIQSATEHPPHLILLDYLLPDLNGDDVCRAISGNVILSAVPVVVMSAKGEEVGGCFDRMGNVVDVLPKPFSPDALLAVVKHALEVHARPPVPTTAAGASAPEAAGDSLPRKARDTDSLELPSLHAGEAGADTGSDGDGAALAGNLAVVSIADVLLLLQERQLTGLLRVGNGPAHLEIHLRGGRVDFAGAQGVPEEFLLGHFLVRGRQVEREAFDRVIEERSKVSSGELLGAELCRRGLLTPAGLKKAMVQQSTALVYEGLRWDQGRFSFHPGATVPPAAQQAALGLPVDGLIMQGLRRVTEWRIIEQEVGDFETIYLRNEDKIASFSRDRLLREEGAVLDLISGKNTVREIVSLSKMGSYDVTQILFRLLRSKLVRRRVAPVVG